MGFDVILERSEGSPVLRFKVLRGTVPKKNDPRSRGLSHAVEVLGFKGFDFMFLEFAFEFVGS